MNNSPTSAISYTTAKQSIQLHIFYALPQVSSCVSSHCSSPSVPLLFSLMWDISSGSWFSHCCSRSFTSPTLCKKPTTPTSQNRAASNTSGNVSFLLQPHRDFPISAVKEGELRMPAEGRGRKRDGGSNSQTKAQLQGPRVADRGV